MQNSIFILFSILLLSSCARPHSEMLSCGTTVIPQEKMIDSKVGIYIFSHPNCGFCGRAMKELGNWATDKPIDIVMLDFSGEASIKKNIDHYKKYNVEVQNAILCDKKQQKYIPKIYFFDSKSKKFIMKLKGWNKTDFPKVEKKLKKYLNT